jgi:DNA-binding transcriptional regulator LsrR (DeoR family)
VTVSAIQEVAVGKNQPADVHVVGGADPGRGHPPVSLEAAIVARLYYIDGKQKNDIAHDLGVSRFKVARLIDEARASGIVRIYVDMPADIDLPIGEELSQAFSINRSIVVRSIDAAPDAASSLIGTAGARYLESVLDADDVLGISWGTSLTHLVDALHSVAPAEVVQLVGGVRSAGMNASGTELVRRLAQQTGAGAYPLHAPLLVRTASMARELRDDPALADAIQRFTRLSIALVGIGSWQPPKSSLYAEFSPQERAELLEHGAAADLCALVLDAAGRPVASQALSRTVGITLEELRRVPEVIAVAGGDEKIGAIAATLRSGIVNTLVTDSRTALALLDQRKESDR